VMGSHDLPRDDPNCSKNVPIHNPKNRAKAWARSGCLKLENKEDRAPLRELKLDQPLQADIAMGVADIAAGRVKDFDASLIIERGRNLLAERRRFQTAELPDEDAERIVSSRMDPRHDHLDALLDDETAEIWLVEAIQASPYRNLKIEPSRTVMPVREVDELDTAHGLEATEVSQEKAPS